MPRIEARLKSGIVDEALAVDQNGNEKRVPVWVLTKEEQEQIQHGYRCVICMQVFDSAFPDECPICKLTEYSWFSPRRDQSRMYAQFSIEGVWGPSPIEDYDLEADDWRPKTQILLPGRDF